MATTKETKIAKPAVKKAVSPAIKPVVAKDLSTVKKPAAKKTIPAKKVAAKTAAATLEKGSFNRSGPTSKGMSPQVAGRLSTARGLTAIIVPVTKKAAAKKTASSTVVSKPAVAPALVELGKKIRALAVPINDIDVEAAIHGYAVNFPIVDGKVLPILVKKPTVTPLKKLTGKLHSNLYGGLTTEEIKHLRDCALKARENGWYVVIEHTAGNISIVSDSKKPTALLEKPAVTKKPSKTAIKNDFLKRAQTLFDEADAAGFSLTSSTMQGRQCAGILLKNPTAPKKLSATTLLDKKIAGALLKK
jgi:hypothetical protein